MRNVQAGMSRDNDRHRRRDLDIQRTILAGLADANGPVSQQTVETRTSARDAAWQIDDLIKRGYIRQPGDNDVPVLQLTPAGLEAARGGLRAGAAERQTLLDDEELQHLHRLMWESAADDSGDRRRHASGIKWLLEDHFAMRIKDREGGKARPDALGRLEAAGAIERLGGGKSQRTPVCWVYAPDSNSEARSLRSLLRVRISEDTNPGDWITLSAIYARYEDECQQCQPGNKDIRAGIRRELQALRDEGLLEFLGSGEYRRW